MRFIFFRPTSLEYQPTRRSRYLQFYQFVACTNGQTNVRNSTHLVFPITLMYITLHRSRLVVGVTSNDKRTKLLYFVSRVKKSTIISADKYRIRRTQCSKVHAKLNGQRFYTIAKFFFRNSNSLEIVLLFLTSTIILI